MRTNHAAVLAATFTLTLSHPSVATVKKRPAATDAQRRSMAELGGKFKWGMSHEDVWKALEEAVHVRYKELIEKQSDVNKQDDLRKRELEDVQKAKSSLVKFEGKKTGWDVSIIDKEFAQRNDESMIVMWEKDQRRFLFFANGKLYKQFIAFDAEHPAFRGKSFDDFVKIISGRYGQPEMKFSQMRTKDDMVVDHMEWPAMGDYQLWAIDQSGFYGNYCLRLFSPTIQSSVEKAREARSPKRQTGNALIDAVTKPDEVSGDRNADVVDEITGKKKKTGNQGSNRTSDGNELSILRAAPIVSWGLLCLFAPVHASERPEPSPPVGVAVVVDSTDAPQLGPRVRAALKAVVDADPRVSARPYDIGVLPDTGPLAVADGALAKADSLFRDMDLDPARTALEQALGIYEERLQELARHDDGIRRLRDAQVLLAKLSFFGGSFDAAKEALRRAFVLDPKLMFSTQLFPVQMKRVVVEARLLFDTLGSGRIEVSSEPSGAEIFLNGARVGRTTPASIDASAGPNTIEIAVPGYAPGRRLVDVGSAKGDAKIAFTLSRDDGTPARCRAATAAIAAGSPGDVDLAALARNLEVEALVLVHVFAVSDLNYKISGAVYRKPRTRFEAREERAGGNASLENDVELLARSLVDRVVQLGARPPAVAEAGRWRRFRASKAFWWVIGGVGGALLLGVAVGAGVGASEAHRRKLARDTVLFYGGL